MSDVHTARPTQRALVDRVLTGPGETTPEQRACAFRNAGLPAPVGALVDDVATRPSGITDDDVAAARAAGFTEDQLFELMISAALGRSDRLYRAGLAALNEATADGEVH